MGRSYTPTYRVEVTVNNGKLDLYGWDCKCHGRPTNSNAEKYRRKLNESFGPKGVNWHISKSCGVVVHVSSVRVIRQSTGAVVATAKAPLFEVA